MHGFICSSSNFTKSYEYLSIVFIIHIKIDHVITVSLTDNQLQTISFAIHIHMIFLQYCSLQGAQFIDFNILLNRKTMFWRVMS